PPYSLLLLLLLLRPPLTSTLFPYTTLFRSQSPVATSSSSRGCWRASPTTTSWQGCSDTRWATCAATTSCASRRRGRCGRRPRCSDRKSTRLNSSHVSNLVCRLLLEKKKKYE